MNTSFTLRVYILSVKKTIQWIVFSEEHNANPPFALWVYNSTPVISTKIAVSAYAEAAIFFVFDSKESIDGV